MKDAGVRAMNRGLAIGSTPSSMVGRDAGKALFWRMVVLYHFGSAAAIVITFLLAFLGLEFTGSQWIILLAVLPIGVPIYTLADVVVIRRHIAPIRAALTALDRQAKPGEDVLSRALVRALNLPLLSFLRVTFLHGPLATLLLALSLLLANWAFASGFAAWQILTFAAAVMFFASPTHAIFEFFAVSREMEPTIGRLTEALGSNLIVEHQEKLISIRLKEKLLYLAICVAALPLLFFAGSVIFKVERLLAGQGVEATGTVMLPLYIWIAGVIAVCMFGALVMALLTAKEVSRAAERMISAMREVEKGQLDEAGLMVMSTDEYADLFRGFNLMLESLREEQRILAVSHDLAGELQLSVLIGRIMQATTELLGADRSSLFLYDAKTEELYTTYAQGLETREIRIPSHMGIAGAVFTAGTLENVPDVRVDPRFDAEVDLSTGYTTHTILCAPIANKAGGRIGVTQVLNKHGGEFTTKDEARLRAFSAQIAVCLENAQLFDDVLNMKNYNESILQSTSNAIVTLDAEERIVTANAAAISLLELRQEEFVGQPAAQCFSGPNAWVAESLRSSVLTGESSFAADAEIVRPDSKPISVNMTAAPLIDVADAQIGSMLVLEDITSEKRVRSTMARYMSKEVADQLLAEGEDALVGKDQRVSVLFSDVRGFTTIAEALGARETVALLNEYFTGMVDVILSRGGILDKYIGDAIMALFGAPFTAHDDADRALAAADQMMRELARFNAARKDAGKPPLEIGVGLSSGEVVLGNIGSEKRLEYTAIGDCVNLASRLEGVNKQYGTDVLLSEFAVRQLTEPALLREIDLLRVKGKERPVAVYESLSYRESDLANGLAEAVEAYGQGLAAYRARDWRESLAAFERALRFFPEDRPSAIYRDRAKLYASTPPAAGWDGVFVLTEK